MTVSETPRTISRRTAVKSAAWSVPVIAAASAAPAMAISPNDQRVEILFDGGGGRNGFVNTMYVNLMPDGGQDGTTFTTVAPMTFTIDVVGLNDDVRVERSFRLDARQGTSVERGAYDSATNTTRLTWTVPAGATITPEPLGSGKVNLAIRFLDGLSGIRRITNKVVVRSVTGGTIVGPTNPPVDSSVVGDYTGVSSDGIY